jgi:CRP-like cAMP-binding protein
MAQDVPDPSARDCPAEPTGELVGALRSMPLFEELSDEQARWLAERGTVVRLDGGERVLAEGTPAEDFYVLIEGEVQVSRSVGGYELVIGASDQPGAWGGTLPQIGDTNVVTVRALGPSRLFRVPMPVVQEMLAGGFPILRHLLAGLWSGTQRWGALVGQFEKLQALGKLAAGLAHELNNPAAAARRAASQLRQTLRDRQAAVARLVAAGPAEGWPAELERLEDELMGRAASRVAGSTPRPWSTRAWTSPGSRRPPRDWGLARPVRWSPGSPRRRASPG